jgi:hypothetical protein
VIFFVAGSLRRSPEYVKRFSILSRETGWRGVDGKPLARARRGF